MVQMDSYYARNRAKALAYQKARYADPVFRAKKLAHLKQLRATPGYAAYREMYGRKYRGLPDPPYPPPGVCECCGVDKPSGRGGWHLDHNHETGEFRGWLCSKCNGGIGLLGDCVNGVKKALNYLETRLSDGNNG